MTQYGDDENYKIALSGGFPFAGGRGHVLLSGEQNHNAGIENDGDRDWNEGGVATRVQHVIVRFWRRLRFAITDFHIANNVRRLLGKNCSRIPAI